MGWSSGLAFDASEVTESNDKSTMEELESKRKGTLRYGWIIPTLAEFISDKSMLGIHFDPAVVRLCRIQGRFDQVSASFINVPVLPAPDEDQLVLEAAFCHAFQSVISAGAQGTTLNIRGKEAHR